MQTIAINKQAINRAILAHACKRYAQAKSEKRKAYWANIINSKAI